MKEKSQITAQGRDVPNQIVVNFRADTGESDREKELDNLVEALEEALEAERGNILTQEEIDELLETAESHCGEAASAEHHKAQPQDKPGEGTD